MIVFLMKWLEDSSTMFTLLVLDKSSLYTYSSLFLFYACIFCPHFDDNALLGGKV